MVALHFGRYDHDRNGLLDWQELKEMVNDGVRLHWPFRSVTAIEVEIVLRNYDLDHDGMVSQE